MKKWLLLLLLAVPAEAVETITVVAKNKESARYNAVWAANMKCNRKGFWADPLAIGIVPITTTRKFWRAREPVVIKVRRYEASLDYNCANVFPNPHWRPE
tara:strand:- start:56 stop:355 length:300 start_codon:yes stop_codon:yes gene_type:complete